MVLLSGLRRASLPKPKSDVNILFYLEQGGLFEDRYQSGDYQVMILDTPPCLVI